MDICKCGVGLESSVGLVDDLKRINNRYIYVHIKKVYVKYDATSLYIVLGCFMFMLFMLEIHVSWYCVVE